MRRVQLTFPVKKTYLLYYYMLIRLEQFTRTVGCMYITLKCKACSFKYHISINMFASISCFYVIFSKSTYLEDVIC